MKVILKSSMVQQCDLESIVTMPGEFDAEVIICVDTSDQIMISSPKTGIKSIILSRSDLLAAIEFLEKNIG